MRKTFDFSRRRNLSAKVSGSRSTGFGSLWSGLTSLGILMGAVSCTPAPKESVFTDPAVESSAKPDAVARIRALEAMSLELSRLERFLKPHLTKESPSRPACAVREVSSLGQFFYRWNCNSSQTGNGSEIIGTELTTQPENTRQWVAQSRLETRYFDNERERERAPGTLTVRRMEMNWAGDASLTSGQASLVLRVGHSRLSNDSWAVGPNWEMTLRGVIEIVNNTVRIQPGAVVEMKGQVNGRGDTHKTVWAKGQFQFTARTAIVLDQMTSNDCTKPLGLWDLKASGGGVSQQSEMVSDLTGLRDLSGTDLGWGSDLCSGY